MQATIQQQYVVTFKSHSHVVKARLRMTCLDSISLVQHIRKTLATNVSTEQCVF